MAVTKLLHKITNSSLKLPQFSQSAHDVHDVSTDRLYSEDSEENGWREE